MLTAFISHVISCNIFYKQLHLWLYQNVCSYGRPFIRQAQGCAAQSMDSAAPVEPSQYRKAHQTYPATRIFGISPANASAISRLPTLAMQCRARPMKVGLRLARSFLIALFMRRISSLLEFTRTEMKRQPCVPEKG